MTNSAELESTFWKALRSDMTVMLGTDGAPPRPMTAQMQGDENTGPLWFFTSTDTDLGATLADGSQKATMTFASKGNNVWASATGTLEIHMDRAMIDHLWNPFVGAWFTGKDDPKMRLLRFDAGPAHVWDTGNSIVTGVKMLMGADMGKEMSDKSAQVRLDD
jgi:general stress protein 26